MSEKKIQINEGNIKKGNTRAQPKHERPQPPKGQAAAPPSESLRYSHSDKPSK